MADIGIRAITKRYGPTTALNDVNLSIADGEFVVLLGPTGAGKTTLLRVIAGLEKPEHGSITIDGVDVTRELPALRDVSFVFQQYSLYPHLTVGENLAFPLKSPLRRLTKAEIDARVRQVAQLVRIDHKLNSSATTLSGGEMQRVAIGRALVREPAIYLMDEPLSSLDAKLRSDLRLELAHIHANLGATILYVTHDQTEAMTMASRIGILDRGKLVQIGTAREIYENPVNSYVAARLGTPAINLLPLAALRAPGAPAGAVTIGARTEHVRVVASDAGPARLTLVEHLGNESHVHLDINGHRLTLLAPPEARWRPGDRAEIALENPLYFDSAGQRVGR